MNNLNKDTKVDSLIAQVDEQVSTNTVLDLKSGIYNLFISLFNDYAIEYGPIEAVRLSTEFLDEISLNFKSILNNNIESKDK